MEQALYAEDPKFASQMQGSAARARLRHRISIGAVGVVGGLGLVFLTVIQNVVWWGAIGFALMVGGVAYAITPAKVPKAGLTAVDPDGSVPARPSAGRPAKETAGRPAKEKKPSRFRQSRKGPKSSKQTFMRRMEERWDHRRED